MNNKAGPFRYYFAAFRHPTDTFRALIASDRYLHRSFAYIAVPIAGYTLLFVFLTIGNGAPSVFTPWLNIPKEAYYSINRFLLAPSMLLSWLAAAGVMQIAAGLFRGTGTYEQTLSAMALCISIAMWGGLAHDLPMSILSALRVIDARQHEIAMNAPTIWRTLLWTAYSIYFFAFLCLFPACVRAVHGLSKSVSFGIGLLSFIVFQVVFLVFNR